MLHWFGYNICGYISGAGGGAGQVEVVVCNAFKSLISEWYYGMRLLPRARVPHPRSHLRHVLLGLRGVARKRSSGLGIGMSWMNRNVCE